MLNGSSKCLNSLLIDLLWLLRGCLCVILIFNKIPVEWLTFIWFHEPDADHTV